MYGNLVCGHCESVLEMDTEFEEAFWLLIYRFVNAHIGCGFALPNENVEYAVRTELPYEDQPPQDEGDGTGGTIVE